MSVAILFVLHAVSPIQSSKFLIFASSICYCIKTVTSLASPAIERFLRITRIYCLQGLVPCFELIGLFFGLRHLSMLKPVYVHFLKLVELNF